MKKVTVACLLVVLCLCLCSCKSSDYKTAVTQYEAGEYQQARDAFLTLADYKDSAALLMQCYENLAKVRVNGAWAKENCVDEYNSPTEEWYLVTDVEGVRKGGSVTQEPIVATFMFEDGFPYLSVLRNGTDPIVGTAEPEEVVIVKCKNEKDEEFGFLGALYPGKDRMILAGPVPQMDCFTSSEELQFAVTFPSDLDATYYFTINFSSVSENPVLAEAMEVMREKRYAWYYDQAVEKMLAGSWDEAEEMFVSMGDYKDADKKLEQIQELRYDRAEELFQADSLKGAESLFTALGDYRDAKQRLADIQTRREELLAMRKKLAGGTIAAGNQHTAVLKEDGTVLAVGYNGNGQCDTSSWQNIVAIAAGSWNTFGLRSDGSVVSTGTNDEGQRNVSGWTDIVDVKASDWHTLGLKADGTVVAAGDYEYYTAQVEGATNVSDWKDIIAIAANDASSFGLKADGTVVMAGYAGWYGDSVSEWTDIVAIAAGTDIVAGLKSDGTVVMNHEVMEGWTDITAIACGRDYILGRKADGTVVAELYYDDKGQCDVSGWTDIVAVDAGYWHSVGLRSDGTVVAVGQNNDGQCNVRDLAGVKLPAGN